MKVPVSAEIGPFTTNRGAGRVNAFWEVQGQGAVRSARPVPHMAIGRGLLRSFFGRQPGYVKDVIRVWGNENIRMTNNHAKFFMLRNERWNICCRSSMNLNRNPRLEQFDIDDSLELCEFFAEIVREIYVKMPPGLRRGSAQCDLVFADLLGGGISDQYSFEDVQLFKSSTLDIGVKLDLE